MQAEIYDPVPALPGLRKQPRLLSEVLGVPPLHKDPDPLTDGRRAKLTVRSIDEILAIPDSPADLLLANGYLERGESTTLCGMGGVGKSRLAMQLAMMHCAGRPFLGWETRSPGLRWLFMQTENGSRRLKSDLTAMLTAFGPHEQLAIKSSISLHTIEGEDDGCLLLTDPDNLMRALDAVEESLADIVVWDPLRDFTGDDLNKDMVMSETVRNIRFATRYGDPRRTCLILHHAAEGRAGAAKAIGYDRGTFGRNSKSLKGHVRAQINVAPAGPDDNSQIILASGKCNNFEEFSPFCARLNPDTMLYEVVEDFDFDAWRESLAGDRERPTTDALAQIIREAGGGLEKNEAIARLQSAGMGRDVSRSLIHTAVEAGLVEETAHHQPGRRSSVFLTLA